MLARAGVGFQAAWDRTPQHDVQLLIITRLRGRFIRRVFEPRAHEIQYGSLVRRRALNHVVSRSKPGLFDVQLLPFLVIALSDVQVNSVFR